MAYNTCFDMNCISGSSCNCLLIQRGFLAELFFPCVGRFAPKEAHFSTQYLQLFIHFFLCWYIFYFGDQMILICCLTFCGDAMHEPNILLDNEFYWLCLIIYSFRTNIEQLNSVQIFLCCISRIIIQEHGICEDVLQILSHSIGCTTSEVQVIWIEMATYTVCGRAEYIHTYVHMYKVVQLSKN